MTDIDRIRIMAEEWHMPVIKCRLDSLKPREEEQAMLLLEKNGYEHKGNRDGDGINTWEKKE